MHSYDQRMGVRDGNLTAGRAAPILIVGTSIMALCAVAAVVLIWSVAVPTGPDVCVLTYPGPRNCFVSDRLDAAVVSTVVLGMTSAVAVAASVTLFRRGPWAVGAGVALVLSTGLVAFVAVAWIPAWA
ncbi:CHASE2 domain-containing sensor protein [Microbacterium trichothecenolyticum]|uniref:CHASE2 domain-containing sensor protein n=2 Tax=Microbacterium trichothecenolyticum TaxID=69370 RepID=A0ABU0TT58_MICTR|nr:CHASE2 domain-containing sensor protein [Microbacterium trichothecenolyticum]